MSILDFVGYMSPELGDMLAMVFLLVLIFNVITGCMYCFFGYKIYKLVIMIQGFLGGAVIGAIIGLFTRSEIGIFICAFCIGALGAFLSWYLFYIGVFLQAFWTGMLITIAAMIGMGEFDTSMISASIMAGIFLGVLACILIKVAIVFLTAFSGALTVGGTLGSALGLELSATIVVCVVFFTLGFLFQMYMTRRKKKIQEVEEKTGQSITVRMSAPMKGGYTGLGIAFLLLCFTGMYRSGFNYVIYVFMNAMRYRKMYDMMYCAVGFGIGYFITKSKELKSKGAAMEFSVSAMICGLIGADAALILRAVGIVIINHIPVFSVYFMRIMLSRYSLVIGLGGFVIGYVVFDLITGRTSLNVKQVGPAEKKQESRMKAAAKMRPAAEKATHSVERVHIFAPNIDNELNYVFSEDILYMMKTMPVIHDNGTWTCSCGSLCTEEYCTICGMIKEDVKAKFTYQYLKWHRDMRLAQEAEQEKELQIERERIRQERLMRRSGAKKN